MALYNPSSAGISFESIVCPEIGPRLVVVQVFLKFKRRVFLRDQQGQVCDEFIYHSIIGESNVYFPFYLDSAGASMAAYFKSQFYRWMPELTLPVCHLLSRDIVNFSRRLAIARGGAMVVTASVLAEEAVDHPQPSIVDDGIILDGFHNFPANFHNGYGGDEELESSKPPRGLSCGEISKLKQERFENGGGDDKVCSVCLEEFSHGVKITPLPCSHTFHSRCITSWLKRTASCPLCRFDITRADTIL